MGGPLAGFDPAAGMSVPEGDPGGLEAAAGVFSGVAGSLGGHESSISGAAGVPTWSGAAASAYTDTTTLAARYTNQSSDAFTRAGHAAKSLANQLRAAQDKARRAIAQAEALRSEVASISSQWDAAQSMPPADGAAAMRGLGMWAIDVQGRASGLQALVAEARDEAQRARQAAAAAFNGVAGMAPSVVARETDGILTAVRNGDYSVLSAVTMNHLSEQAQLQIGAQLADDVGAEMDDGADEGELADLIRILGRYRGDEEFTVGFFNQLGGARTSELVQSVADSDSFFGGETEYFTDFAAAAIIAPMGFALATASRDDRLDDGYLDDFLGPLDSLAGPESYDLDAHWAMAALIYPTITQCPPGGIRRWDPDFLYHVARKTVVDDAATGGPMMSPFLNEEDGYYDWRNIILDAVAHDPEVAQRLVNGAYTEAFIAEARGMGAYIEHSGFADILLRSGYSDQGQALGNLLLAATQRGDALAADEAARNVIIAVPGAADQLGEFQEGLYPALASIGKDHLGAFEFAALQVAEPGSRFVLDPGEIGTAGGLQPLTYDQSHDFLRVLFKDEDAGVTVQSAFASRIAGHVESALAIDNGAEVPSEDALMRMQKAGALQELGGLAAGHAYEGEALEEDQINGYARFFVSEAKSLLLAKVDKAIKVVPGASTVENYLVKETLEKWFPTDNQIHAVRAEDSHNIDLELEMKHFLLAEQVERGELPPETLQAIQPNGTVDFAAVATGPGTDPRSHSDVVGSFDFNGDDVPESFTEEDLLNRVSDRTNRYAGEAWDYMIELRKEKLGDVLGG